MKNNTLHNAFPIVAAAIGNRFGIKVKVGGDQAYTDGKLIQLPAYNGNDPDYQDYAWGLLAMNRRIFVIPTLVLLTAIRYYAGVCAARLKMSALSMNWPRIFLGLGLR